jgi:hypothetical protein
VQQLSSSSVELLLAPRESIRHCPLCSTGANVPAVVVLDVPWRPPKEDCPVCVLVLVHCFSLLDFLQKNGHTLSSILHFFFVNRLHFCPFLRSRINSARKIEPGLKMLWETQIVSRPFLSIFYVAELILHEKLNQTLKCFGKPKLSPVHFYPFFR